MSADQRQATRTRIADLASATDLATTIELLDMYAREPMGASRSLPDSIRGRLAEDLPRMENLFVVLAEGDAGAPLGLAFCLMGYSTFYAKPLVNIHDLAVVPAARGRGVGRALLAAVAEEARARGCCKVTLEVRSDNDQAKKLYERFGFSGAADDASMLFWTLMLD